MITSTHTAWLVPVRLDPFTGSGLAAACALDPAWLRPIGLAMYCAGPSCERIVGGIVPGSVGIVDLWGEADSVVEALLAIEARLSLEHAARQRLIVQTVVRAADNRGSLVAA
jgi:hypothetical protein